MDYKIFYAHSKMLYDSDKKNQQLRILRGLGSVIDPAEYKENKFSEKVSRYYCEKCGRYWYSVYENSEKYQKCVQCSDMLERFDVILNYLLDINHVDTLVFTDYNGYISRGVYNEIDYALKAGVKVQYMKEISFEKDWNIELHDVKDWKFKYAVMSWKLYELERFDVVIDIICPYCGGNRIEVVDSYRKRCLDCNCLFYCLAKKL